MPARPTTHKTGARIVAGPQPVHDSAVPSPLLRGRQAFAQREWGEASTQLLAADRGAPLDADDLERAAVAAHLCGNAELCAVLLTRAFHELTTRGDVDRAARCAFWQGMTLFDQGQPAAGSGWMAKARRLLDEHHRDVVERGYLKLPEAIGLLVGGDMDSAERLFAEAAAIGDRFGDEDLRALARQGRGRILTQVGQIREGLALLDEVMVGVTTNEISPITAGVVYCSVIEACYAIFDLRRAQEWTTALGRWCDTQKDLVPYHGTCLARRSEILQLHGAWNDALTEAVKACDRLSQRPRQQGTGHAFYQLAEVHRVRGEFKEAGEAYRAANKYGRSPEPGHALLRFAQGHTEAAIAALRRTLDEARDSKTRCRVLIASVEVLTASGDLTAARQAADDLLAIAAQLDAPLLHAYARHAQGAVLLAESKATAALPVLREAVALWRDLDVPYEAARASVLIGLACRACGDEDSTVLEFEAARNTFERLGARPDVERVCRLIRPAEGPASLTAREIEVLGLLATGRTNRAIAERLGISEKTVARHLSNIFIKIGVSTRAAATAYAYRHKQVH